MILAKLVSMPLVRNSGSIWPPVAAGVAREDVVAHLEGKVDAVEEAEAGDGGVADERGVDGDLVGLEVLDDVLVLGLAAVLLAVGDDVDDAAAAAAGLGERRRRRRGWRR